MDPSVAREFVEKGFDSKQKIAQWIHENAKIPRRRYWDHVMLNLIHEVVEAGIEPFAGYWAAGPDELIPVFEENRINVVVVGGETNGHFSIFMGSPMRAKFRANVTPRYRVSVDLGAGCGLRQGEIFAVSPDDIDPHRPILHVVRQVKFVRGRLIFALPKGGKTREGLMRMANRCLAST